MLTEICQELHNWFDRGMPRHFGKVSVSGGVLLLDGSAPDLQPGQFYRLVGTVFNDGVHKWGDASDQLTDERAVDAALWEMAVPQAVLQLAADIATWQAKYGGVGSLNMSPYTSESFGGYSYSKGGGGSGSAGSGGSGTWQAAFAPRLNRWRKLR